MNFIECIKAYKLAYIGNSIMNTREERWMYPYKTDFLTDS